MDPLPRFSLPHFRGLSLCCSLIFPKPPAPRQPLRTSDPGHRSGLLAALASARLQAIVDSALSQVVDSALSQGIADNAFFAITPTPSSLRGLHTMMHANPHNEDDGDPPDFSMICETLAWVISEKIRITYCITVQLIYHSYMANHVEPTTSALPSGTATPHCTLDGNDTDCIPAANVDMGYDYYNEICIDTTARWSTGPRTKIEGFTLTIPRLPPGCTAREEWNYVFDMIRRVSRGH